MLDLFEKSFEHIPRVEHGDWPRVLIQDGYVLQPPVFHRRPHVMRQVIGVEGHDGPGHDGRCHHWLIWRTTSVLLVTPTIRSSALRTTTRSASGSRRNLAASISGASSRIVMRRLRPAGRILSTRITSTSNGRRAEHCTDCVQRAIDHDALGECAERGELSHRTLPLALVTPARMPSTRRSPHIFLFANLSGFDNLIALVREHGRASKYPGKAGGFNWGPLKGAQFPTFDDVHGYTLAAGTRSSGRNRSTIDQELSLVQNHWARVQGSVFFRRACCGRAYLSKCQTSTATPAKPGDLP